MKLLGKATGTEAQCVDFIMRHNHGEYNLHDVKNIIVYTYFKYNEGINPVMLVSQMIHETGNLTSWWSARPRRNPAGIGVTGDTASPVKPQQLLNPPKGWTIDTERGIWKQGISYPTWMQGIWSHIGRVLCYRFTVSSGTDSQQELMRMSTDDRKFPAIWRGKFNNWEDLNGRWAVPGLTYAQQIQRIARSITR